MGVTVDDIERPGVAVPHPSPNPPRPKPLVVFATLPAHGHTTPLLAHATHLTRRGYQVFFISGPDFADVVRGTGATFVAMKDTFTPDMVDEQLAITDGLESIIWGTKHVFIDSTESHMHALKALLETLREDHPGREVIILKNVFFMGTWPFMLGAPLPRGYDRFPRVVNFSMGPLAASSADTAPFGPGLPPDGSKQGRARNAALYRAQAPVLDDLLSYANAVYAELGATETMRGPLFDTWFTGPDATVLRCSQDLEYPRSDMPAKVRFIGAPPRKVVDLSAVRLPGWWHELAANKEAPYTERKKVVFVAQGTVMVDSSDLLIPTMEALADRSDVIVVAVLGVKGAKLDAEVPGNARVTDYLAYEAVLSYADVFVTNGGYGGFLQSIMNGVPMVLAGTRQDKAEVSMRAEWAGVGVNLRTDTPSPGLIRDSVVRVLSDGSFKARTLKIRRENERMDCYNRLEGIIRDFSA